MNDIASDESEDFANRLVADTEESLHEIIKYSSRLYCRVKQSTYVPELKYTIPVNAFLLFDRWPSSFTFHFSIMRMFAKYIHFEVSMPPALHKPIRRFVLRKFFFEKQYKIVEQS